jgi:hypothetical protein
MSELSHVGMTNCWICNEGAEILLDRRMQKTLKMNMGSLPNIICSKCESQATENDAIWLISIRDDETPPENEPKLWNPYRTGGCALIKKDAARRSFASIVTEEVVDATMKQVDDNIYFYIPDKIWDILGLPRGEDPTDV